MDTLAERLKFARMRAGLNQSELARRVGLAPQSIQAIESGKVHRTKAMNEIASILEVTPEWLDPKVSSEHVVAEATFADALTISIRANRPVDDTVRHRLKALLELNGLLAS